MTVDWTNYELVQPELLARPNQLPRKKARELFDLRMKLIPDRIGALHSLLEANGLKLSGTEGGIQNLNDWFMDNVSADENADLPREWLSVSHDIALFLGGEIHRRSPHLEWTFFTWGKSDFSYQHHVIMGFKTEAKSLRTNMDLFEMVVTYAYQIVESQGARSQYENVEVRGVSIDVDSVASRHRGADLGQDEFRRWLQRASQRA